MVVISEIKPSLTIEYSQKVRELGKHAIQLGIGEPEFDTPALIIEAAQHAMQNGYTRYSDPAGLPELRESIANKLLQDNQVNCSKDEIIVTPGAKSAVYMSLASLLVPGDEVITFSPGYVSYDPQIKLAEPQSKIVHHILEPQSFSINFDRLQEQINSKTKAIILNSPHNPTGTMLGKKEMQAIYELALDNDCYIISDEIYEKLTFSGEKHISPGSFEPVPERVITINGFSKAYAMTGWRIGYLCTSNKLLGNIRLFQQHLNTNTCTFTQKAAQAALNMDHGFLDQYNQDLHSRMRYIEKSLDFASIGYSKSKGGFFCFVDISLTGLDSNTFCTRLLGEKGVATAPGIAFGQDWDSYIRISLSCNTSDFKRGVDLLRETLT